MATIRFESLQYPVLPGETLLDTLLRHGAPVAHSCRKGSCGCCQVRVLEGQVEQAEAGGRAAEGHVLACVCRPAGDVVLHKVLGITGTPRARQLACEARATAWQPWRSYAVIRAWAGLHVSEQESP